MGRIVQLSKNVINQIAAGEVIERPYSVVKELVENSIDAGALRIGIDISNECRNIRVADNGSGIHPEDIVLAFTKHATSKIQTGDDLYNVKTMGFRGEALASIISISKLTCTTRTNEFDYGTKVECEDSEVKTSKIGCAVGTIMEIRDLFYSLPARLKFLKSAKTEFSYINELIQSLALAHPEISFELKNNGKSVVKTTGQGDLLITLKELFSEDVSKHLRRVDKTDKISGLHLSGYISTPDYTRASKKDYYLYVNSRMVKCPVFLKSIDTAYKNLTGNSRYPFIVLNLNIPTEDVDVNVHPTKKEVKYKNPNQIFNFIYTSVDSVLSARTYNIEEVKVQSEIFNNQAEMSEDAIKIESPEIKEAFIKTDNKSLDDIYVDSNTNFADILRSNVDIKSNLTVINNKKDTKYSVYNKQEKFIAEPSLCQEENIIGQYKKTYILIEKDEGLEIVDQHIAEERYIYEQLKKKQKYRLPIVVCF